jgi:multiple sugar transport system ATP-binding protein
VVGYSGTTTLYVTHDQVEALSLGDRVAVMREGRIVQCDDPISVYDVPASEFVGGFLGNPPMNFLSGTLAGGNGVVRAELGPDETLPAPRGLARFRGKPVRIGVRAEAIGVSREPRKGAARCVVEVFEPLGASVLITATLAGQRIKVQAPASFRADRGEELWLILEQDSLRWYDPDSGTALLLTAV